jgi:hypothetical protein
MREHVLVAACLCLRAYCDAQDCQQSYLGLTVFDGRLTWKFDEEEERDVFVTDICKRDRYVANFLVMSP